MEKLSIVKVLVMAVVVATVGCPQEMPEIVIDPLSPIGEPLTTVTGNVSGVETNQVLVRVYFHWVSELNGDSYAEAFHGIDREDRVDSYSDFPPVLPHKVESNGIPVDVDGRWAGEFLGNELNAEFVVEVIAVVVDKKDHSLPHVIPQLSDDVAPEEYLALRPGVLAVTVQPRPEV